MAKLFFRWGSMGAGKSLAIISVAHNYSRIGQKTKVFTTALDDRFGKGVVASRIGVSIPAEIFTPDTVFTPELVGDVSCVLVDESHFLNKRQIIELHKIAAIHKIPVICYGLRTDYMGNAFEGSAALGATADSLEELKSVCQCGRRANFNIRIDSHGKRIRSGEQIHIGGDDSYQQACSTCFYQEDV